MFNVTGTYPQGSININTNGTHDVTDYSSATIAVPVPTGTINIDSNGTHDVTNYASAVVNVPIPAAEVQVYSTTRTPSSNATTISFTGLAKEPKSFSVMTGAQIALATTRYVTSVMANGTTTYATMVYTNNTRSAGTCYYSTAFTWSYNNGTLTVTSPSGASNTGGYFKSGTAYRLICTY